MANVSWITWEQTLGWSIFGAFIVDYGWGAYLLSEAIRGNDRWTPLAFHVADSRGDAKIVSLPSEWNLPYLLALGPHVAGGAWKLLIASYFFSDANKKRKKSTGWSIGSTGSSSWDGFVDSVRRTTNFWRWMEYAVCGPTCTLAASLRAGSRDMHFLLSQMALAVSVVVVAFEQKRKPYPKTVVVDAVDDDGVDGSTTTVVKGNKKAIVVPWAPAVVAGGLFACQWTLVFWQAHAAGSGFTGVLPGALFVAGVTGGFVAQTIASRGYGDGIESLKTLARWGFGGARGGSKVKQTTVANARDVAAKIETFWVLLVTCGKVVFSAVVLHAK